MITRLIYLLLFVSPQLLLYLYLRERLPDPTRPERARRVRIGLATTFAVFNLPWVLVAGRALSGSMWGVGRIPYLGPWIAWQLLGWIFGVLVAVYVAGKAVWYIGGQAVKWSGGQLSPGPPPPPAPPPSSPPLFQRPLFPPAQNRKGHPRNPSTLVIPNPASSLTKK